MRESSAPPSPDTNPLAAHLDRGWELLDRGDVNGATLAANTASEWGPQSPELLTLRGAIAAASGEIDAAIELYGAAIESDPDYASPILQSAELHLYSLDEPERALELAERAGELAEEDDERADSLLLTAEAELALGRAEGAAATLSALEELHLDEAVLHGRAGQLYLDLDDLPRAEAHLRAAIELDRSYADAWHSLGVVYEARGDGDSMRRAWLETRKLDLRSPRVAWHLAEAAFEHIAEQAFEQLPEAAKLRLANVPILISDYPSIETVAEGNDPRMLGFFTGVPFGDKMSVGGGQTQPDCCFLYQRNIENACRHPDNLEREIHITLWHETAHFFGLDDDDLEDMGLG